jgi:DNA-binding NarL/FixJ family response regulator
MTQPTLNALVVEDDRSWQQILVEILTDCGLTVSTAGNLDDALFELKSKSHRIAVVDLSLSPNDHNNFDGLRVLEAARKMDPNCRTVLLTGFATVELAVSALTDYGVFTFLRKESFHRGQFKEVISRALASAPQAGQVNQPAAANSNNNPATTLKPGTEGAAVNPRKALIVEDDAGWRNILEELLTDVGFQVRICASYGEGLGYLRRERISLAVVDLLLNGSSTTMLDQRIASKDLDGYQLLASTRAGGVPTIVVSGVGSPEEIKRAYAEESIFAYMEKQSFDRASFLKTVEEATKALAVDSELSVLTDREREVFDLLAQGKTNKEIAEVLFITTNTVKRHLKSVFEKLDVHTRSAAAAKAIGKS